MAQNQNRPTPSYSEDEIELMDYLRVLWRYRFWILGVTLLSGILTFGLSLALPPVYEVSTVIEPGRYGCDTFESGEERPRGEIYYSDIPQNLKTKISQGAYDHRIRENVKLSLDKKLKWKIFFEKDSYIVRAVLETTKPNQGLAALNELIIALSQEYSQTQQTFKDTLAQEIQRTQNQLEILNARQKELEAETKRIKNNTQRLIKERDTLVANPTGKGDPTAMVLLTTTLQQNIMYYNQILDQLTNIKKDIDNKQSEIVRLKLRQDFISPIKIIQEPQIGPKPIKPKKVLNAAIAGILGLFMSVFGAFFAQYITSYRERESSRRGNKKS